MGSKFHFSQFINKYLTFKDIEYFIRYIKFEMQPVLFYFMEIPFISKSGTQIDTLCFSIHP